jgi:hypothetical protein
MDSSCVIQEEAMWTPLQRLVAWLVRTDASGLSMAGTDGLLAGSWHGDHWQNLLCSPMDARHYVMEDWASDGTGTGDIQY